MMSAAVIDHDLTCGGCDYNLRGLPRDGACPECGHGVAATLAGFSAARAHWLRRVATGSILIAAGVLLGGAGVTVTIVWNGPWLLYVLPAAAVIAGAGTWMFASRDPSHADALGAVLRGAGVLTAVLQIIVTLYLAAALGLVFSVPVATRHVIALCQATAVVWGVTAVLTCIRAGTLAMRLDDLSGASQAGMLAVMSVITFLFGVIIWREHAPALALPHLVATVIHSGWSIVFFLGFAIVLRRRARLSIAARPG